jgi:hypothetical protein
MLIRNSFCAALLLLALSACAHQAKVDQVEEKESAASGVQIESKKLWEFIESGVENSPEIKYARGIGAKLERGFSSEMASASEITATPPSKCLKLPPIEVVVSPEGKVTKAVNRNRSCWVNGTNMAIKATKALQLASPPKGLLSEGNLKFSWTPDLPEKNAADKETTTN